MSKKWHRLWYLDFVRGLAVIGMIVYHFMADLFLLYRTQLNPFSPPFIYSARLIAATFLFLVGFSFYLSKQKNPKIPSLFTKTLLRSILIFVSASLISIVTFFVNSVFMVRFGILHLISISLLLLLPLSQIKSSGILFLLSLVTIFIKAPTTFSSFDYYPIFPWFGVVLLGYVFGRKVPLGQSGQYHTPAVTKPFMFLGRHSLIIYLIHQPIFFLLLLL